MVYGVINGVKRLLSLTCKFFKHQSATAQTGLTARAHVPAERARQNRKRTAQCVYRPSSCRHTGPAAVILLVVLLLLFLLVIVRKAPSIDLQDGVEALQRRRTRVVVTLQLVAAVEAGVLVVT